MFILGEPHYLHFAPTTCIMIMFAGEVYLECGGSKMSSTKADYARQAFDNMTVEQKKKFAESMGASEPTFQAIEAAITQRLKDAAGIKNDG